MIILANLNSSEGSRWLLIEADSELHNPIEANTEMHNPANEQPSTADGLISTNVQQRPV